jgi:hypothetical protein
VKNQYVDTVSSLRLPTSVELLACSENVRTNKCIFPAPSFTLFPARRLGIDHVGPIAFPNTTFRRNFSCSSTVIDYEIVEYID